MHPPSLPAAAGPASWFAGWSSAWSRAGIQLQRGSAALHAAWQRARARRMHARALRQAEREMSAMSLRGLRDIGAPETLLERRSRAESRLHHQLRAWQHPRG